MDRSTSTFFTRPGWQSMFGASITLCTSLALAQPATPTALVELVSSQSHASEVSKASEAEARAELVASLSIEHLNLDDYISELQETVGPSYQHPVLAPLSDAILYADDPWLAHTRPNQHLDVMPIESQFAPDRELKFGTLRELFRYRLGVTDTNNLNRGMHLFGNEKNAKLRSNLRYRVRISYDQVNFRLRYRF